MGQLRNWLRLGGDDRYGLPKGYNRRRYVRARSSMHNYTCIGLATTIWLSCATALAPADTTSKLPTGFSRSLVTKCIASGTFQKLNCEFHSGDLSCRLLICSADSGRIRQGTIDYRCQQLNGD